MKRCDVIVVALPGDKPRPALVVQSDELALSESILICPFTSGLEFSSPHRIIIDPSDQNGLKAASVLMIEKVQAVRRNKCGQRVGALTASDMVAVNAQLAFVLGLSPRIEAGS